MFAKPLVQAGKTHARLRQNAILNQRAEPVKHWVSAEFSDSVKRAVCRLMGQDSELVG